MSATLQVLVEQVGPSTSKVTARSHSVFVDRPAAKGGADRGPLGGEYLLIALGGCFTSHLLAAIRAREADIQDVKVKVSGTLDGSPESFTALTLDISAAAKDEDLLRKLVTIAERSCQVTNTLRASVPISLLVQGSVLESVTT
jgi:putative redox protein